MGLLGFIQCCYSFQIVIMHLMYWHVMTSVVWFLISFGTNFLTQFYFSIISNLIFRLSLWNFRTFGSCHFGEEFKVGLV
jgi:hypothetical protein